MAAPGTHAKGQVRRLALQLREADADSLIMVMISWVVSTRSTSGLPSCWNSSLAASIFLAVQGMMAM